MARRQFASTLVTALALLLVATGTFAAANKAPVVTSFIVPAISSSPVPIQVDATDSDGTVTGYLITETSLKPGANTGGWTSTRPTQYTTSSPGLITLYAWAKDNKSAVSSSLSAPVTIYNNVYPGLTTIQACIDSATNGDTCYVYDGTYLENIDFKGKAVTVTAVNGPGVTAIESPSTGGVVVRFATGEQRSSGLDGFTIRNGRHGVYCTNSSPTISNCIIENNSSVSAGGAGVYCSNSSPLVTGCTIRYNDAGVLNGGGILAINGSAPVIDDCEIHDNLAIEGGGVSCGGTSTVTNCRIHNNHATDGGGIFVSGGAPTIASCEIWGNSKHPYGPNNSGGGIKVASGSAPVIDRCEIYDNIAGQGGGIHCEGNASITNCNIYDNNFCPTCGNSGIVVVGGNVTFANCTIQGNSGTSGGGISLSGATATIEGCTIVDNVAKSGLGGGISSSNSTISVNRCFINRNISDLAGGGIALSGGGAAITDSEINGNWISQTGNIGGGGIYVFSPVAPVEIINCIVAGNGISSNGDPVPPPPPDYGGGIFLKGAGITVRIVNSTISGNTAWYTAGGVMDYTTGSSIEIVNSIVSNNVAGYYGIQVYYLNAPGPTITYSNIQGGWSGPGTGNIDDDPLFVDTTDSNPAKWDFHLQASSPCIDQGDPGSTSPDHDIDGDSRLLDGKFDIGADEYVNLPNPPPEVILTNPPGGATGVPLTATVEVTFSEALQTVENIPGITVISAGGSSVTTSNSTTGNILTIYPAALNKLTKYTVTIPAGAVSDLQGAPLASAYTFSFTTGRR